ncbi:MAG: penicillin-binding protein 2 [Pseudomonadota bacterium]
MIRTPLRPLARILKAREDGDNPDAIERENIRARHEEMQTRARRRAQGRLFVLGMFFMFAFATIGARMGTLAQSVPAEPRTAASGAQILAQRADIVDREGRILATNFETHSLYAHPQEMIEPETAADALVKIFPDLDRERLVKDFTGKRKFVWVKGRISPEQLQMVHDIGEPGLHFGPREMRLYPNGALAAHVLGGTRFGEEDVNSAEILGTAGVEKRFDARLRDPARGHEPLRLSIDLSVQAAVERVLHGGMTIMNAKGATAILMDAETGELIALASLPDFDPNDRPAPPTEGNPDDSPIFNRAVQGLYELGSVFKIFTVAQAMDLGLVNPSTMIDTTGPIVWGKHKIRDFRNYGPALSTTKVVVKSSNIGTARIAQMIGVPRHKAFMEELGLLTSSPVELIEAPKAKPFTQKWSDLSLMTMSYGHGVSTSPMNLAAAYATLANGGYKVEPTLLRQPRNQRGPQVLSEAASAHAMKMLRLVVSHEDGTASLGDVAGYAVGGKTGTADKARARGGGYYEDKVIATFASVFPAHDPKYVLVVTLDEPSENSGEEPRRTAGWTAVPVAAEIIRRVAPLMGLRPEIEPLVATGITDVSQQAN